MNEEKKVNSGIFRYRQIDIEKDRETLLEFHCQINYQSETEYARSTPYAEYREKWMSTSQPRSFLSHLEETMKDEKTIAEILEDVDTIVGYIWVIFSDIPDYNMTIAEIMDLAVMPDLQNKGIGTNILEHIEDIARKRGATLLRSDTGMDNLASRKLHEKLGLKPYRIYYEKVLED